MAFGKKKDKDEAAPAASAAPPSIEEEEDESGGLFPSAEPESDDDSVIAGVVIDADGNARKAGEPAAAPDPFGGTDALLNMFQTTQAEAEDRSVLLDLAGDVEMDDLLEELHTMAVALGLSVAAEAA